MNAVAFASAALCLTAAAASADWRRATPEGWLGALEIRDIDRAGQVLGSLREGLAAVGPTLTAPFGDAPAERPWALVAVDVGAAEPSFLLLVPTDDYQGLCNRLNAAQAEDLAIGTLMGLDIAIQPRGPVAAIALLSDSAVLDLEPTTEPPQRLDSDVSCLLSPRGLRNLADQLAGAAPSASRRNPFPFRSAWPSSLQELLGQAHFTTPVWRNLAAAGAPVGVGFDSDDAADRLRLVVAWGVAVNPATKPGASSAHGDRIAHLDFRGPIPSPLISLAFAAAQSASASIIEAPRYSQPQWDDFVAAAGDLIARAESPDARLDAPGDGEPLAANQSFTFGWPGSRATLGDALQLAVVRWNLVVAASRARSPMRIALEPLEAEGGWRIEIDVLAAGDRELIPEEQQILRGYYGHDDRARLDIVPLEGNRWLATLATPDRRRPLRREPKDSAADTLAEGLLHVDRWMNWSASLKTLGVAGSPKREPFPTCPPASLRVWVDGGLRVEATLPRETFQAFSSR